MSVLPRTDLWIVHERQFVTDGNHLEKVETATDERQHEESAAHRMRPGDIHHLKSYYCRSTFPISSLYFGQNESPGDKLHRNLEIFSECQSNLSKDLGNLSVCDSSLAAGN